jgi:hypothetical protein
MRFMASGKTSKKARSAPKVAVRQRSIPWGTVIAVGVIVLFAAAVLGWTMHLQSEKNAAEGALKPWIPSDTNQDPSKAIPGIQIQEFAGGQHVRPNERVAYTHSPPFGGAHDANWAACLGVVYPKPVRNENMVHALEHGAVWIAYDPARISGEPLDLLRSKVSGKPYTLMSPYPGMDHPVSLQSWGHQLKVDDANDPRIDQFIQALRVNQYTHPEVGASCAALGPGAFDQDNPPPFDPAPPGPDAVPEAGRPGSPQMPDPVAPSPR